MPRKKKMIKIVATSKIFSCDVLVPKSRAVKHLREIRDFYSSRLEWLLEKIYRDEDNIFRYQREAVEAGQKFRQENKLSVTTSIVEL